MCFPCPVNEWVTCFVDKVQLTLVVFLKGMDIYYMKRKLNGNMTHTGAIKRIEQDLLLLTDAAKISGVPAACIASVEYCELRNWDLLDIAADLAVYPFRIRKDSSTGCMQIYARVARKAIQEALDDPSFTADGSLYRELVFLSDPARHQALWRKLKKDRRFNILCGALNLRSCAVERMGQADFSAFAPDDYALVFARYNGFGDKAAAYGRTCAGHLASAALCRIFKSQDM